MIQNNPHLCVEYVCIDILKPSKENARIHSKKQIETIAKAIQTFGFNNPILIDKANSVIAGHARFEACKLIGIFNIPVIRLEHLTPEQVRAYRIADNRIAELAEWDEDALRIELQELSCLNLDFDLTVVGFETAELDLRLLPRASTVEPEYIIAPNLNEPAVTQLGDIWQLGAHRILCGSALEEGSYTKLLGDRHADLVFTDPPYNVPINGHVLTKAGHKHAEFSMASGEMSEAEFAHFLDTTLKNLTAYTRDGSIHFICMDWRHIYDLIAVGRKHYNEMKNICIWNKNNGGMGSLYRSKHEMIAVFKHGTAPHTNNVELGKFGRYRTNVWDYAGQNSPHAERDENLAMHPTVKPLEMVADAICDCSNRHQLILDPFGGSGTTLIAAERTQRAARLVEIEPCYVDTTIKRWEAMTGKQAILFGADKTYAQLKSVRLGDKNV